LRKFGIRALGFKAINRFCSIDLYYAISVEIKALPEVNLETIATPAVH
jgi:hypothetical protein